MQFTVTEVPERERFEARDEAGTVAGVVTYQLTGNIIVYTQVLASRPASSSRSPPPARSSRRQRRRRRFRLC
jgi:hypothetical protein